MNIEMKGGSKIEKDISLKLGTDEKHILEILQKYGEGYIVGGYVRDLLLGLEPKDCDFVTNIPYEKLLEIFSEFQPKEIGKAFGIIQIKYNEKHYEIAKYRKDIGTPDDRRKQKIEFTNNIMEDLKRRDFTINAIAFDGKEYRAVENSFEDIAKKRLKFVGDAGERIKEDPLRIMRFIRFMTEKKLNNKDDISLLLPYISLIKNLSMERMRDEFTKILVSEEVGIGLELLEKTGILRYLIPYYDKIDENTKSILNIIEPNLELRLAILLRESLKDEKEYDLLIEETLKRLKYPNKIINNVVLLTKYHLNDFKFNKRKAIKRMVNDVGYENISKLFKIMEADKFDEIKQIKDIYDDICQKNEPVSIKDLAVNGKDIINVGIAKGKDIGEVLKILLDKVLDNPELNNRDTLLKITKEYVKLK